MEKSLDGAPFFSVIVATYNAAHCIQSCISSVTSQSDRSWELLISDGASSDATIEIVQRNSDQVAWFRSGQDKGIYDAWNLALQHCRGEYVMFLGADDRLSDNRALERLREAVGIARPDIVTSRGRLLLAGGRNPLVFGRAYDWRLLGRRMVVCHPGMLHSRRLFLEHGPFDSDYRIAGDLEFLTRLPKGTTSLDVDTVTVDISDGGVSRLQIFKRLREQRLLLSRNPRFGPFRAWIIWLDRLVRVPVAAILGKPI